MEHIVAIPKVGNVAFPDHMSDAELSHASRKLHDQANPLELNDVIQHVVKAEPKGANSESYRKMAEIAQALERNPALLNLAIARLSGAEASST